MGTSNRSAGVADANDLGGTNAAPTVVGLEGSALPAAAANTIIQRNAANSAWVLVSYTGTNLTTDLSGKAATSHSHAESDVTNLTTDLAGKAALSHSHAESDVTSLVTDLAAKVTLAGLAGGQTVIGGTAASETLVLKGTAHATKGSVTVGEGPGLTVDKDNNLVPGTAALATNATNGFVYIGTCAGTPTGIPAGSYTGRAPMVFDSTNGILYVYKGGAWVIAVPSASSAPTTATYICISADATLTAERTLAVDTSITLTDAGANSTVTLSRAALTGDITASAGSNATTLAANIVSNAKFRQGGALTVVGVTGNAGANVADIAAVAASGAVLRESGSTIGFGTIVAAGIASDAVTTIKILDANVTPAKISNRSALSVFGRSANSSGVGADITAVAASGSVLCETGSTVAFTTVATAGITDAAITMAKLANLAGMSVIGRSTNSAGVPAAITAVTAGHVLTCVSGTSIAWQAPAAAAVDINGMTAGTTADPLLDTQPIYDSSAAANRKMTPQVWWIKAAPIVDFRPSTSGAFVPYGVTSYGNVSFPITGDTTHFAGMDLTSGGVASGYYSNRQDSIAFSGAKYRLRAVISSGADIVGGTWRIGFSDAQNGSQPSNGIFFRWASTVNTGKFQCVTRAAATETATDSTITVALSTAYVLEIEVNAAGNSVTFYINGTLVATNTTNIPNSGQPVGWTVGHDAATTNLNLYRFALWADDALVG